jgi:hypothetical protein
MFLKISRVSTLDTITSFVTVSLFAVSLHLARTASAEHMHSKKHKMKFSKKASFIRDCYNSYYFLFQL